MTIRTAERSKVASLEPGDLLTRAEFHRRYEAMPELKRAELIEGIVHIDPQDSFKMHGEPRSLLIWFIGQYKLLTPGIRSGANTTVILDDANEFQPGLTAFIDPARGGRVRIIDGYVNDAPEFIAEVAQNSTSIQLHEKLRAYQRNGVTEYLVWRTEDAAIDWFVLREGKYERLEPDADGLWKSPGFPGLWLDGPAMIGGDMPAVFVTLNRGLASEEHAVYMERLQSIQ